MSSIILDKILITSDVSLDTFFNKHHKIYTFLNPVSYLDALKNKELFANFDGLFVDGGLLVKAIKIVYGKQVQRWSFDMGSMAPYLFNYAINHNKSVAIIATKQDVVEKAVSVLKKTYIGLNVSYFRNGYFESEEELENEANKITKLAPDFLIVGMGIINQEKFLLKVYNAGYQGVGFTCGGFIHQTAQNLGQFYPKWINKYGLRFFYRMYKEPHTRRRYAKAAFMFPIAFLKEKFFE